MKESTTSEVTTAAHKVIASIRIAQEVMERHPGDRIREKAEEMRKEADAGLVWIEGVRGEFGS